MLSNKANYKKSNSIETINFYISKKAKIMAEKLLAIKSTSGRQTLGAKLLKELEKLSAIPHSKLKISDAKQWHKKASGRVVFKQYGYYRPQSKYIYIHNRTAVRGQILAPKTFLDTLLHEWMHHYDGEELRLNSIHSSGFYMRLKDLKEKLEKFNA